jgi:hypothetical protein
MGNCQQVEFHTGKALADRSFGNTICVSSKSGYDIMKGIRPIPFLSGFNYVLSASRKVTGG